MTCRLTKRHKDRTNDVCTHLSQSVDNYGVMKRVIQVILLTRVFTSLSRARLQHAMCTPLSSWRLGRSSTPGATLDIESKRCLSPHHPTASEHQQLFSKMQSTATPESNKFTIRPAQPADYDTLSELFSITFRSLESIVTYEFRETTEADLRAWIKATRLGGDTQARVAVDEKGKICGFMTFSKASSEIATQCGSLPKGTNEKLRRFRVGAMNGGRNRVFEMIGPFYGE